jgi:hypothetical protein
MGREETLLDPGRFPLSRNTPWRTNQSAKMTPGGAPIAYFRSLAILSGEPPVHQGFIPFTGGFTPVDHSQAGALACAMTPMSAEVAGIRSQACDKTRLRAARDTVTATLRPMSSRNPTRNPGGIVR